MSAKDCKEYHHEEDQKRGEIVDDFVFPSAVEGNAAAVLNLVDPFGGNALPYQLPQGADGQRLNLHIFAVAIAVSQHGCGDGGGINCAAVVKVQLPTLQVDRRIHPVPHQSGDIIGHS